MSTCCENCGSHDVGVNQMGPGMKELYCRECGWERTYPVRQHIRDNKVRGD